MATTYDIFEMAPPLPRAPRHTANDIATGILDFIKHQGLLLCDTLAVWHQRAYERRTLMHMDDRMLSDIGVSPSERDAEGSKPCWVK